VRYFNRRHGRTGTLWEGRFRACLVESSEYVLGCYRYIELNPARARMVTHPSAYLWSSYAANTGMRAEAMVKPHCEYLALSEQPGPRQAAYRGLFENPLDERLLRSIRDATNAGHALVSDAFKARVAVRTQRGKPGPKVEEPAGIYAFEPG
jgi:putative transposase